MGAGGTKGVLIAFVLDLSLVVWVYSVCKSLASFIFLVDTLFCMYILL